MKYINMDELNKKMIFLYQLHKELGIENQIDFDKFYLYSIIAHSTAIEGSTVTVEEAQILFDEGLTSSKRTLMEQLMNVDLKNAYDDGRAWISSHPSIDTPSLCELSSKVLEHTGAKYNYPGGSFDASKGELRKISVHATGGESYMDCRKVPMKLSEFCKELNSRRQCLDKENITDVYDLSFWAHSELVTIHPWADGNGRMSRLLMNLLQWEYDVLPMKLLTEDKQEYISALKEARKEDNVNIFSSAMKKIHSQHLTSDIDEFLNGRLKWSTILPSTRKEIKRWAKEYAQTRNGWPWLRDYCSEVIGELAENENDKTEVARLLRYRVLLDITDKIETDRLVTLKRELEKGSQNLILGQGDVLKK